MKLNNVEFFANGTNTIGIICGMETIKLIERYPPENILEKNQIYDAGRLLYQYIGG